LNERRFDNLIEKAEAAGALSRVEAEAFMEELLSGQIATPEIVRMLLALNQRAVIVDELTGFARVMRQHAAPVFAADEPRPRDLSIRAARRRRNWHVNISTLRQLLRGGEVLALPSMATVRQLPQRLRGCSRGPWRNIDLPLAVAGRSVREIGIGFCSLPRHTRRRARHAARQQM